MFSHEEALQYQKKIPSLLLIEITQKRPKGIYPRKKYLNYYGCKKTYYGVGPKPIGS